MGFINYNDGTNYRNEVEKLATWCSDNNLFLNVESTKDICNWLQENTHTQHPRWASMVLLWRALAVSNVWVCTLQRTSPGQWTLHQWRRKPNSASTSHSPLSQFHQSLAKDGVIGPFRKLDPRHFHSITEWTLVGAKSSSLTRVGFKYSGRLSNKLPSPQPK